MARKTGKPITSTSGVLLSCRTAVFLKHKILTKNFILFFFKTMNISNGVVVSSSENHA